MSDNLLLDGILSDAKAEADRIIAEAQLSKDKILADAKIKADKDAKLEKASFEIKKKTLQLKLESDKNNLDRVYTLKVLDSSYNNVLALVENRWAEVIASPGFSDILVDWICEAAIGLNLPKAKVAFSKKAIVTEAMLRKAESLVEKQAGAKVELILDETPTTECGVVVSSLDSKISYNNLISVRTRRFNREIKDIVQDYTCSKAE